MPIPNDSPLPSWRGFNLIVLTMGRISATFTACLALAGRAISQTCSTTTLLTDVPTNGTNVALQSYSYCGGSLNVTVR